MSRLLHPLVAATLPLALIACSDHDEQCRILEATGGQPPAVECADGTRWQIDASGSDVASPGPRSSCAIVESAAGEAPTVQCDDGSQWQLAAPKACSVSEGPTGGYHITCPDGTSVTLRNGVDGKDGDPGTRCSIDPAGGGRLLCDDGSEAVLGGTPVPVAGTSCTVSADAGLAVVACDDGSSIVWRVEEVARNGAVLLVSPVGAANSSRPTFDWSDSVLKGATYRFELARDGGFTDIVESATNLTTSSYTLKGLLDASTSYFWRVSVQPERGDAPARSSAPVVFDFRAPTLLPVADANEHYNIEVTGDTTPTFRWYPGAGAARYILRYGFVTNPADPITEATVVENIATTEYTPNTPLPDANGELLKWEVRSVDENGIQSAANVRTFSLDNTPPRVTLRLAGGAATSPSEVIPLSVEVETPINPYYNSNGLPIEVFQGKSACAADGSTRAWLSRSQGGYRTSTSLTFGDFVNQETATLRVAVAVTDYVSAPTCAVASIDLSRYLVSETPITENTIWKATDRPYVLRGSLQVAKGVKLTLDPGTRLIGGQLSLIGSLELAGTADAPVSIDGTWIGASADAPRTLSARWTTFTNVGWGWAEFSQWEITDSRFAGQEEPYRSEIDLRGTRGMFARNVVKSCAVTLVGGEGRLTIVNNHFTQSSLSLYDDYRGEITELRHNSFLDPNGYVLSYWGSRGLSARENYWVTTDQATIDARVRDRAEDTLVGVVDTSAPLAEPHPDTPSP